MTILDEVDSFQSLQNVYDKYDLRLTKGLQKLWNLITDKKWKPCIHCQYKLPSPFIFNMLIIVFTSLLHPKVIYLWQMQYFVTVVSAYY